MKLIVSIPAYNEEKNLADVIKSIPKKITGIEKIEILVWNDGSTDKTVEIAKKEKSDYVFSNKKNLGLAKTFRKIVNKAIELKADILVNTDADNQYDQKEIAKLIKPILENNADLVNGNRKVGTLNHMPLSKKYGNMLGSWTIRKLTGCNLADASSGFRAYSRACLKSFDLVSNHTYTHETIIQAVFNDMVITEVPITFKRRKGGGSRLISGVLKHIGKSGEIIIHSVLEYKAFKVLLKFGLFISSVGFIGIFNFLYFFFIQHNDNKLFSLLFGIMFVLMGFMVVMLGLIADLIRNQKTFLKNQTRRSA